MRPTYTVETPEQKVKVELYSWMTGGQKRAIANAQNGEVKQELTIKACVKSIGGKEDDILKALDELHGKDSDFVFIELAKVVDASTYSPEQKKT